MDLSVSATDLPAIADFVKLVFELILVWMEVFPNYEEAFRECQTAPLLFCVDLPAAISQCCFELVELLGKIWGQCARATNYFRAFRSEYIRPGDFARQDKTQENGFAASLTNLFGEANGFQRIINVIKGTEKKVFPLSLVGTVLT